MTICGKSKYRSTTWRFHTSRLTITGCPFAKPNCLQLPSSTSRQMPRHQPDTCPGWCWLELPNCPRAKIPIFWLFFFWINFGLYQSLHLWAQGGCVIIIRAWCVFKNYITKNIGNGFDQVVLVPSTYLKFTKILRYLFSLTLFFLWNFWIEQN